MRHLLYRVRDLDKATKVINAINIYISNDPTDTSDFHHDYMNEVI
jgi:hypothetical protein